MKLSKLNFVPAGISTWFFIFILASACNNSQEPEKKSAVTNNGDMTGEPVVKNTSKKIGSVVASTIISTPADRNIKMAVDKMGYYNYTEIAPTFPGGQVSLESYISNNIEYPREAIDNEAEGTVSVLFTIDENGNIANVKTAGAKLGYGLEEEAIRVVSDMPKWVPGTIKGKNVKAWYTIPLTYRLES